MTADEVINQKAEEARMAARVEERQVKKRLKQTVEQGRSKPLLINSYNMTDKKKVDSKVNAAKIFLEVLVSSGMSKQ